jgi:hypothetical protein
MVDILSKIKDIEDYCKAKPEAHVFKTFKISSDDFLKFKNIIIDLNSYSKINDKIMK